MLASAKRVSGVPWVGVVVGFSLLLAAWLVATPPFAAPDEASHYLRALSIANGQLLGAKIPYTPAPAGLTPTELAWANDGTRAVTVPARLSPPDVTCTDGQPDIGLKVCREATEVGNYQPVAYFLPALALKVSNDATTGLWLARLASMIPSLAFIILAAAMLWDGSSWSLLGLFGAMTPMVLFVSSVVNPNGLEISSCLAFAASTFRMARLAAPPTRVVWWAFCLSGVVAIMSWQLGPVFVVADLAVGVALMRPAGLRGLLTSDRHAVRLSIALLITAAALDVIYGQASGASHATIGITPLRHSLYGGLLQLGPVLSDSVGTFGALTVHLPEPARWVWWFFVLVIVGAALWLGSQVDRAILVATIAGVLTFPVLFYAWVYRFTGFGLQGRYVLPMTTLIPLVAGEVVHRHRLTLAQYRFAAVWPASAVALTATFQAYAWWLSARVAAGAPHTIRFYAHATWRPPLGWTPWMLAAALGTVALIASAAMFARQSPPSSVSTTPSHVT